MRSFRAPALPASGGTVQLDPAASHHLLRVTGVARGERVRLMDAAGQEAEAELVEVEDGLATLRCGPARPAVERPEVWLLQGLVKHEAFDTLVRMATELGATHIVPVLAERSVARGDRASRWTRIAEAAALQCRRADLPVVHEPAPLELALRALPPDLDRRVYAPGAPARTPPVGPCALLLGPEGGLSAAELAQAATAGFLPEGLGALVLRADTAAAAVLARRLGP